MALERMSLYKSYGDPTARIALSNIRVVERRPNTRKKDGEVRADLGTKPFGQLTLTEKIEGIIDDFRWQIDWYNRIKRCGIISPKIGRERIKSIRSDMVRLERELQEVN